MRHCLQLRLYLQLFSGLFGLLLTSLAQAEHARTLDTGVLQRLLAERPGTALIDVYRLGYSNLFWYRDGIDAWRQTGLPLLPA